MNSRRTLIASISFASITLVTACGGGSEKPASAIQPTAAASQPTPDAQFQSIGSELAKLTRQDPGRLKQDTPDNAVKSWWEIVDAREKLQLVTCEVTAKAYKAWQEGAFTKAVTSEARDRFGHSAPCILDTYKRTVDEVKTESETRAVVYSTVWITTTPPDTATKEAIAEAKQGTKFRYVLEKLEGKWTISDVFRLKPKTSYSAEEWDKTYSGTTTSFFFGTVYSQ